MSGFGQPGHVKSKGDCDAKDRNAAGARRRHHGRQRVASRAGPGRHGDAQHLHRPHGRFRLGAGHQQGHAHAGNGTVGFDITYSGAIGSDGVLGVGIDADRNAQTGRSGLEYMYVANSTGAGLAKWDGTQWADFAHQPTSPGLTSTDFTFTITLADIGGVTTFDFVAVSLRGNDSDGVPDNGVATYPVAIAPSTTTTTTTTPPPPPPPTPRVKALLIPSGLLFAKAGKVLRVPPLRLLLIDGTTVTADSQTCTLTFKGKKLPALAGGCAWKIPKTYRKARLVLKISYSYGGATKSTSWPVYPG
ncbi:MAG: hypothetical protein JWO17_1883 [Actinomycetia bacterium]|nr:hypothetical protein [Actinomycetes bacterium]